MYRFLLVFTFLFTQLSANEISSSLPDSVVEDQAHGLFIKGYKFFAVNKSDSAFVTFKELKEYVSEQDYPEIAIHYRAMSGAVCAKFGFFKESLVTLKESEQLALKYLDSLNAEWGVVYGNYGYYYNSLGLEDKVYFYMNKAQVVLRANKETKTKVLIDNTFNLAAKAMDRHDLQMVNELYDEIEEYLPILGRNQPITWIKYYTRKGKLYLRIGKELEAREWLEKAIALMDKHNIDDFRNQKLKHDLLAFYYYKIGKHQEEIYHREQLDVLYENQIAHVGMSANLHNLALAYEEVGMYEKALKTHDKTLKIQAELDASYYSDLLTYLSKVSVLQLLGRYQEALDLCEYAIEFGNTHGLMEDPGYTRFFGYKARLLYDLGEDIEIVDSQFKAFISITNKSYPSSHAERVKAHYRYARYLFSENRFADCMLELDKAIRSNQIVGDAIDTKLDNAHLWKPKIAVEVSRLKTLALSELAHSDSTIYAPTVHLKALNQSFFTLRKYISGVNHMDQKMGVFGLLDSIATELIDLSYQVGGLDSLDILTNAWSVAENTHSVLLQENISMYNTYRKANVSDSIIDLLKGKSEEIEAFRAFLVEDYSDSIRAILTSKIVSLERFKSNLVKDYPELNSGRNTMNAIDLKGVQGELTEDELMISYFLAKEHVYIFYASKNQQGWKLKTLDRGQFEHRIEALRISIVESDLQSFAKHSYYLYSNLLKPLESIMEGKELIIVPHGNLNTIPFECLITKPIMGGQNFKSLPYLIKDRQVEFAHSVGMFRTSYSMSNTKEQYVGIAPEYSSDSSLVPLKMAEHEIQTTATMFSGLMLKDEMASERQVRKKMKHSNMIHFAAHAEVDTSNAYNTKIRLTPTQDSLYDDDLYAHELLNLPIDVNLVVLNGCSTGSGALINCEGVMSLGRSLTYAGANSVITNLWDVSDRHASDLLAQFFTGLKEGESAAFALRQAKLAYLAKADQLNAAPVFWAAPVLMGRPEKLNVLTGNIGYLVIGFLLVMASLLLLKKSRNRKSK